MTLTVDEHTIIIDAEDAALLSDGRRWRVGTVGKSKALRVYTVKSGRYTQLHRLLLPDARFIRFANGNQLDFRRANLIASSTPTPNDIPCPFDSDLLRTLYLDELRSVWEIGGLAQQAIGHPTRIKRETVRRWLKAAGITPRTHSEAARARVQSGREPFGEWLAKGRAVRLNNRPMATD